MLIRKPSPPIASIASPMRWATASGVPIRLRPLSKRSEASCRKVLPLPHCWNLSSAPDSPLVVSFGSGLSTSYCEKSMSVIWPMPASAASMKLGSVTMR